MSIDSNALDDRRLVGLLDELTKNFSDSEVEMLKQLLEQNKGHEIDVLMSLMDYTHRTVPVPIREFVEGEYYLNLRGQVWPKLLDDLEELFENVNYNEAILTGAVGWGKCCKGDSIVITKDGVIHLKDIKTGDKVLSVNDVGEYMFACVKATKNQVKDCYKYIFESGLSLECSDDHPIRTNRGWINASGIKEDDFVASIKPKELKVGTEFNEDWVKFLAYMTAEGNTSKNRTSCAVRFTNGNSDVLKEFTHVAYMTGALDVNVITKTETCTTLSVVGVMDFIKEHDLFGKKAVEKRIPSYVWKSGTGALALFLNRFFACDGNVYQKTPYKIECCLGSEELANDILLALRMLGIYARKVKLSKSCNGKSFDAWRVAVTTAVDIQKFIKTVGDIYTKPWNASFSTSNGNKDIVPVDYEKLKELRKELGGVQRTDWDKIKISKGHFIGRSYAQRILNMFGTKLPPKWLFLLNDQLCWEKVVSVEHTGKQTLYDIDVPETRNFIANGVLVHNSTFSEIAMCRMLYEISCFKNPQRAFNLMDGSIIALINVSINKEAAKKVVFSGIKSKLMNSPYFKQDFMITHPLAAELRLMNNVWIFPVASGEHSILGYNVFGGVMDEVNFMSFVEDSKRARGNVYDQASSLQTALIRRMKSRYMKKGRLPGVLIQVSSSSYPDDYTEKRIEEAKDDNTIFVRRYSQWDTLPADKYSPERFKVSIGNILNRPRIIETKEEEDEALREGIQIIEVPEDYRKDFEKKIDESIRDLAGLPTLTIKPFFTYRERVVEAMKKGEHQFGLQHPFTKDVTTLQDGGILNPKILMLPRFKKLFEEAQGHEEKTRYKREYDFLKSKPRFIHIDLAKTSMAGFAMGFVYDYKEVTRRNDDGEEYTMRMPIIVMELMLRIVAPKHGEIELSNVRALVHELKSYGYRIGMVSFDQFQSVDSQQQLNRIGINAGELSVDKTPAAYNAYRDAVYEDRFLGYFYEPAYWETVKLEFNEQTGKIDHPAGSSKDVSDAIAGVCYHCVEGAPTMPSPPPIRGKLSDGRRDRPIGNAIRRGK